MKIKCRRTMFYIKEVSLKLLLSIMVIVIIYLFSILFDYIKKIFTGTDKDILVALIIAGSTIVVSVVSLMVGKYFEKKKEIENSLRDKKIPVYEEFVQFTFKVLNHEIDFTRNADKANKVFLDITQKLIIWGSDDVLNKWIHYRNSSQRTDPKNIVFDMEKLLLAIRKDLGHKNYSIIKGDILSMFVKDIQNL